MPDKRLSAFFFFFLFYCVLLITQFRVSSPVYVDHISSLDFVGLKKITKSKEATSSLHEQRWDFSLSLSLFFKRLSPAVKENWHGTAIRCRHTCGCNHYLSIGRSNNKTFQSTTLIFALDCGDAVMESSAASKKYNFITQSNLTGFRFKRKTMSGSKWSMLYMVVLAVLRPVIASTLTGKSYWRNVIAYQKPFNSMILILINIDIWKNNIG